MDVFLCLILYGSHHFGMAVTHLRDSDTPHVLPAIHVVHESPPGMGRKAGMDIERSLRNAL
jgi:hypothetical protein